jgi:hypothetical protein
MALYLSRVETVVSLQQLSVADQPSAGQAADVALEPDAPVAGIAWSRLPKYSFACDAAPKPSRSSSVTTFAGMTWADDTRWVNKAECSASRVATVWVHPSATSCVFPQ